MAFIPVMTFSALLLQSSVSRDPSETIIYVVVVFFFFLGGGGGGLSMLIIFFAVVVVAQYFISRNHDTLPLKSLRYVSLKIIIIMTIIM